MNTNRAKILLLAVALLCAGVMQNPLPAAAQTTGTANDSVSQYSSLEASDLNPYTSDQSDGTDSYEPSASTSSNPAETNGLRQQEEEGRIGEWASPGTAIGDLEAYGFHNDTNTFYGPFDDANLYCQDAGDTADDEVGSGAAGTTSNCISSKVIRYQAGQRVSNFNTFAPMAGVTDTLNSGAYTNQLSNALTSPLAIMHATINLTEPGIAFGLANAMNTANESTNLRYHADNAVYNRLKSNPGNGEIVVSAYESCINFYRTQSTPLSWIEAQSKCIGGDSNAPTASGFNTDPSPTNVFDFTHDPNYNATYDVADNTTDNGTYNGTTYTGGSVIYAVDYLFNNENPSSSGTSSTGPECDINGSSTDCDTSAAVPKLRDAIHAMIGDVKFTITHTQTGAILVKTWRIPPFDPTANSVSGTAPKTAGSWDPGANPYSARAFYRNLVMDRYNDAHALLYLRCRYENGTLTASASGGGTGTGGSKDLLSDMAYRDNTGKTILASGSTGNFWLDVPGAERLLIHLSTRGFRMKPKFIEDLFNIFKAEQVQVFGNAGGSGTTTNNTLPCQVLDTSDSGSSNLISAIDGTGGTSGSAEARALAVKANPRIRLIFALAEKIAFGQYMATLSKAEDFVTNLTGGSYDSLVKQYMLNLIYSTAGTKDLRQTQHLNDQQIVGSIIPVVEQEDNLALQTIGEIQNGAGDAGSGRNVEDSASGG